ncbi:MAG: D-alanyl-D-alanine carboxypeptidase [Bacteroidales bacterium]|nr:D-alanyl-D-alanine carboxypeptidase [Bacteroidales bacterium]
MRTRVYFTILSLVVGLVAWAAPNCGKGAMVGCWVADVASGNVLEQSNASVAFTPASTLKTLTCASAMRVLGANWRWQTSIAFVGGKSEGSVVINASGDPTLDSRFLLQRPGFTDTIVATVKALGWKKVAVTIRDSRFTPSGPLPQWMIEDVPWDFGAAFQGFNYYDNLLTLNLKTLKITQPADYFSILRQPSDEDFDLWRDPLSTTLIVKGKIPGKASIDVSNPKPQQLLCNILRYRTKATTTLHFGPCQGDTLRRITWRSPVLSEVCRSLLKRSDNLMADATLRALSTGALADALDKELKMWPDLGACRIQDGSGLIRSNCVTPQGLGKVLLAMASKADFVDVMPVANSLMRDYSAAKQKRCLLKSGSMTGVRCYAGYILDTKGKPKKVVVVMANNVTAPSADVRKGIAAWVNSLL